MQVFLESFPIFIFWQFLGAFYLKSKPICRLTVIFNKNNPKSYKKIF